MAKRVAVVTGANKGIGLAIVDALCRNYDGDVILTARDGARGESACASLREQGLAPLFHQLDVTDRSSVERLASFLNATYGGLDVLVNNAAVAYPQDSDKGIAEKARLTMDTNFFAAQHVCRTLFPLLRPSARVVHMASALGHLKRVANADLQRRLQSPTLSEEELLQMAEEYVAEEQADGEASMWPRNVAYNMSKVFLVALCRVQARRMEQARPGEGVLVNACCPGFVKTDLNGRAGRLTTEQGAETPVFLALLPEGSPSGQFYKQMKICEW